MGNTIIELCDNIQVDFKLDEKNILLQQNEKSVNDTVCSVEETVTVSKTSSEDNSDNKLDLIQSFQLMNYFLRLFLFVVIY